MDGLTYKFNNYDNGIPIERKEFLNPKKIVFYVKDGDSIYVENNQEVLVDQLLVVKSNGIKYFSTISGVATIQGNSVIVTNNDQDTAIEVDNSTLTLDGITREDILNVCTNFGINNGVNPLINEFTDSKRILIINAIDIEPYLFNYRFLLQDKCKHILDLLERIAVLFNIIPHFFVSKNDTNLGNLKSLIVSYPNVKLHVIKEKYPYNMNQFIIKRYFKEYSEKEIISLDLMPLYKMFVGLIDKKPVRERYVTVIFNNPFRYYLVNTYYGVYLEEMIDSFVPPSWGGKGVYLNNFLRKNKCTNFDNLSLTDNVNTIFVFDDINEVTTKCIKCGKCSDICPVKINPCDNKLDASCIRCGLCNYVCPANINMIVRVKNNE